MLLLQIPMSWIRDIRKLTVTNALANALILYGLITCLVFALGNAVQPANNSNAKGPGGAHDSEESVDAHIRGPVAEILYKLAHLDGFNSHGWFLFIGTSVRRGN
jgi:proton-coupled amino acid transporter